MEALEEKYVKHDSFEEVSRILSIVEDVQKEFEQVRYNLFNRVLLSAFVGCVFVIAFLEILKSSSDYTAMSIATIVIALVGFPLIAVIILSGTTYLTYHRTKFHYKLTSGSALEVVRELIPTLSKSEKWSVLRQFELKLRLSKLGISSEKLFSENTF